MCTVTPEVEIGCMLDSIIMTDQAEIKVDIFLEIFKKDVYI